VSPDPRPTNSFALLMSIVAMDLGAPATIFPNVESRPGSFASSEFRGPSMSWRGSRKSATAPAAPFTSPPICEPRPFARGTSACRWL
jgi:hypothetical protein